MGVILYRGKDSLNYSCVQDCPGSFLKFPKHMHTFEIDMFSTFVIVFLGCLPDDSSVSGKLDKDGFPPIGSKLEHGDPCYR